MAAGRPGKKSGRFGAQSAQTEPQTAKPAGIIWSELKMGGVLIQAFYGILIPFLGTTLGAACVFFMKKTLGEAVQRADGLCGGRDGRRVGLEPVDPCNRAIRAARKVRVLPRRRGILDRRAVSPAA